MSVQHPSNAGPGEVAASRLPRERLLVLDVLRLAAGQCTIHGLIEADVTGLRDRMAAVEGHPTMTGLSVLGVLPAFMRRWGARLLGRFPGCSSALRSASGCEFARMFGAGWGIPLSAFTLMVTIGGATKRMVLGERGA